MRREGARTLTSLVVLLLLAHPAASAALEAVDDSGHTVTLSTPAQRIVSIAPHATELLYAAGAGERIVGAVAYSDFPPPARELPRVGDAHALDVEAILALEPDLVVGWISGNPEAQLAQLRRLGANLYLTEPRRLDDVARHLEQLGRLAGTGTQGAAQAEAFRRRMDVLQQRYADAAPLTVFYQLWDRPLMTVGGTHLISTVIRLCGGVNVFSELDALAPQVETEAVLQRDPRVIVMGVEAETAQGWRARWLRWPRLAAVRDGRLHALPPDELHRLGPRILDGAERLCEVLQEVRESTSILSSE